MKIILALAILILIANDTKPAYGELRLAQKIVKNDLVFKGIENTADGWQLHFVDKKNKTWLFNAQRSNTEPYIFYTRNDDGSFKVNEKIIDNWFAIRYFILKTGKKEERIITKVEAVTELKTEFEKLNL